MDPNIKSLGKYYELAWKAQNENEADEIALFEFEVSYYGKAGCKLVFIRELKPPTIIIRIFLHGKTFFEANLMEIEEVRKNKIDNRVVQLGSSVETIRMSCSSEAEQVIMKFK